MSESRPTTTRATTVDIRQERQPHRHPWYCCLAGGNPLVPGETAGVAFLPLMATLTPGCQPVFYLLQCIINVSSMFDSLDVIYGNPKLASKQPSQS